ncbi:MAG: RDD family protein [bacterium]
MDELSTNLDNRFHYETPEAITLELSLAGPAIRGFAFLIDFIIRIIIFFIVISIFSTLGNFGSGLMLIAFFLLEWLYPVLFEVLLSGQTPGKRLLGIRVISANGLPVSWGASVTRNLLRTADFLPFGYFSGILSCLISPKFQRLGDIAANTLVTFDPQKKALSKDLKTKQKPQIAQIEPPPIQISLELQHAIQNLGERSLRLSPERQKELVNILTPLTGKTDGEALKTILGWAQWYRGNS